jgi:hypothetical protein
MFGLDVKVPFSLVGTLPPAMAERRGCPNVCIDHSAYLEHAKHCREGGALSGT